MVSKRLKTAPQVIGYIKGKSAIHLARVYGERTRNFVGQNFWARGYFVSTVGRDEAVIREYIRNPGERGQAVGSAQALAIGEPPSGGSIRAGRVSDPFSRFERLTH
jgi:putative transposase